MNVFVCIKNGVLLRGRKFKEGEELHMEGIPTDGKGNSLLEEAFPAFKLVSENNKKSDYRVPFRSGLVDSATNDLEEAAKADRRTNSQIRRDIKDSFGEQPDPRMKKVSLIALELKLKMLHGKDAAIEKPDDGTIRTDQAMTLSEAQRLVK